MWFAAGFECLDHLPVAPWPGWLLAELLPRAERAEPRLSVPRLRNPQAAIEGLLRTVENAVETQRNNTLNWAAFHMRERISAGQISTREAATALLAAARRAGLGDIEAVVTIKSGLGRTP
jgi:hypothetical protein